jgi:hypothetical protein
MQIVIVKELADNTNITTAKDKTYCYNQRGPAHNDNNINIQEMHKSHSCINP